MENQTLEKQEHNLCSICDSAKFLIPKAGSGIVIHWICKNCVEIYQLDVLPEYLENIQEFGHWHRPIKEMRS